MKGLILFLMLFLTVSGACHGQQAGDYWFDGDFSVWIDEHLKLSRKTVRELQWENFEKDIDLTITFSPSGSVDDVQVENCPHPGMAESLRKTVLASPRWERLGILPLDDPENRKAGITYAYRVHPKGKAPRPQKMPTCRELDYKTVVNRAISEAFVLSANLRPESTRNDKYRQIVVSLLVEGDGSLHDIRIVTPEFHYLQDAFVRVLKEKYRTWSPAMRNGKPVAVGLTVHRQMRGIRPVRGVERFGL